MTTISTQVSFPVGVRALIGDAARKRRDLERRCVEAIESRAFEEVILPLVDFVDPYSDVVAPEARRRSYRFTDREGELLSIRSDFTPMVARVIAPLFGAPSFQTEVGASYADVGRSDDRAGRAELRLGSRSSGSQRYESEPRRIYYRGDVIRYEASKLGRNREFFQIGAEIIGDAGVAADVEIVLLAAEMAQRCGARPIVAYRDASLLRILLSDSGLAADQRERLVTALVSKRVEALLDVRSCFAPEAFALIARIVDGSIALSDLAAYAPTASVAQRLSAIVEELERAGVGLVPVLDDVNASDSYYTGLQFELYTDLARAPLARGGRYDSLYANFGADVPAVGFTMSVDLLENGESS